MFRRSHCVSPSKYISLTHAYISYRDLELHRSTTTLVNGATNAAAGGDADSRMREKLAALEDLNELLEEPVEEQVSSNKNRYSR